MLLQNTYQYWNVAIVHMPVHEVQKGEIILFFDNVKRHWNFDAFLSNLVFLLSWTKLKGI